MKEISEHPLKGWFAGNRKHHGFKRVRRSNGEYIWLRAGQHKRTERRQADGCSQ